MSTIESNLPSKSDLVHLINSIRPQAAMEAEEKATGAVPVSVQLTVGWSPETGRWGFQTGDNSYIGDAYKYPVWGITFVTHDSDPGAVADEILEELAEQVTQEGLDGGIFGDY